MKIGVLIPTRGDRKDFLLFAMKQIARQTKQPDEIFIMDEIPKSEKPDITYRYRVGFNELVKRGCDLMFAWEDDDYYHENYIQLMSSDWFNHGKPDLMGLRHTTYYNIITQKYLYMEHGHSSMFSTAISKEGVKKIQWGDDNYSFTDIVIWKQKDLTKLLMKIPGIAIGIKHGVGLCGGGGHRLNWAHYDGGYGQQDINFKYLSHHVNGEALNFYRAMSLVNNIGIDKYQMKKDPFLSIITRVMTGKRNTLFEQHKQSVRGLNDIDFEQIYLNDRIGIGMLNANCAFQLAIPHIEGKYVHLLDDDDFYKNPNFIKLLKAESAKDADVILFKMKILTGDGDEIYPKPQTWGTREPKRGQIGGSCFVVKKWVYDKYIHLFTQPSFGDWHFISTVLRDCSVKVSWLDVMMAETGKVSRGKSE